MEVGYIRHFIKRQEPLQSRKFSPTIFDHHRKNEKLQNYIRDKWPLRDKVKMSHLSKHIGLRKEVKEFLMIILSIKQTFSEKQSQKEKLVDIPLIQVTKNLRYYLDSTHKKNLSKNPTNQKNRAKNLEVKVTMWKILRELQVKREKIDPVLLEKIRVFIKISKIW